VRRRVLLTGGTGFVGANLVRELLGDGRAVRVLARPGGDRRALAGLPVEIAEGDLLDAASVRRAVRGPNVSFTWPRTARTPGRRTSTASSR